MNKLLLLALILLLGVLAFGMGIFSEDKSATLSQYVPDSVGQLFSKSTVTESPKLAGENNSSTLPTLGMPDYSKIKAVESDSISDSSDSDGFNGISGSILQEIQQEFTPDIGNKSLKTIKSALTQIDVENESLKSKFDTLSAELDSRNAVLQEIEKQIENLNN